MPKSGLIIGSGIAGMSAGVYLLRSGYDVTIYEKHVQSGGECVGWARKGVFIDGCAHWIVGTKEGTDLNEVWKEVGAIREDTVIHDNEYFAKYVVGGETVTFYSDLTKLEAELLRVAPEDKRRIRSFIKTVKHYQRVVIPTKRPLDYNNPFQWLKLAVKMAPMAMEYGNVKRVGLREYAKGFKSPILQELFLRIINPNFNLHALAYTMQALSIRDAGTIEGGSNVFAKNIEKTFTELGGKFVFNKAVSEIVIENGVATGVWLSNGETAKADYVIASCDAHHLFYDLLHDQHTPKFYSSRFENPEDNPLIQSVFLAYTLPVEEAKKLPKKIDFPMHGVSIGKFEFEHLVVLNHAFDATQNTTKVCLSVLNDVDDGVYEYLKGLSREEYLAEKKRLGEAIRAELAKDFGLDESLFELLDVATPLTYERYTNAYHGSYQAFASTKRMGALMHKGIIKGLKHFYFCGQWIMPPGGLPVAAFSAKMSAIRLCREDRKKFIAK